MASSRQSTSQLNDYNVGCNYIVSEELLCTRHRPTFNCRQPYITQHSHLKTHSQQQPPELTVLLHQCRQSNHMKCSRHVKPTVEVGSLHTLRLESLKLVFQPLHKFLVNKLQFWQVGQDIYFVHDTRNFSNNCLQTDYFTYNSLYHNSSGSEVYIH